MVLNTYDFPKSVHRSRKCKITHAIELAIYKHLNESKAVDEDTIKTGLHIKCGKNNRKDVSRLMKRISRRYNTLIYGYDNNVGSFLKIRVGCS